MMTTLLPDPATPVDKSLGERLMLLLRVNEGSAVTMILPSATPALKEWIAAGAGASSR
jgi:hypothetical protein